MILLDPNPAPGAAPDIFTVEFPRQAQTVNGKKFVPVWRFHRPTSTVLIAAREAAKSQIPGRDEGEDEAAFMARARLSLEAIGVANPEGMLKLGWAASLKAVTQAVALINSAIALTDSWEGFGTKDGEVEPTADAIRSALRIPTVADEVHAALIGKLEPVLSEGNG